MHTSRRTFLRNSAYLVTSGLASALLEACLTDHDTLAANETLQSLAGVSTKYTIAPWTGDDFTLGHRLRDHDLPVLPTHSDKSIDLVIVGGGIAGLATAYYLRNENFLLLEQYSELGGQSRGQTYRGIDYSLGAAYMGTNDGIYAQLFSELGISPTELHETKNAWHWDNKWFAGVSGDTKDTIYRELKRFIVDCQPVWKLKPSGEPRLPLPSGELTRLDNTLFASYLRGYNSQFMSLMDSFCKSSCCAPPNQLSALAGFYLAEDLVCPSYVFKGGNPAIARALNEKIENSGQGRCLTGAFVWRIDLKSDGASVVYSASDGTVHRVDCRQVIVTAPPLVASRIVPELNDKVKAALLWFKYGSYLVANLCLTQKVFHGAYDNWLGSPFTFADITLAETPYLATNTYKSKMGQVLTVYQPYTNVSPGRATLLAGNRDELAGLVVEQVSRLVKDLEKHLEKIVLTRWGHAMAIARPGMFSKLTELQSLNTGPVILAHSSMEGLPSAESAISAARLAANKALCMRGDPGVNAGVFQR
ncbi:MAG: FAD-dependent oxidoreductase [Candidatus Melainabacteria bacterium]|nr:FAD-dependent oxidoreductase [Candidatus Melainabacteria bacterium]